MLALGLGVADEALIPGGNLQRLIAGKARSPRASVALPDDGAHAPNEKFHLPTFARAIQTSIGFLAELGGTR